MNYRVHAYYLEIDLLIDLFAYGGNLNDDRNTIIFSQIVPFYESKILRLKDDQISVFERSVLLEEEQKICFSQIKN